MSSFIRNPKDFWSGVMFIVFGLSTVLIGRDYSFGTAGRMGPGYFPTVLGWILAALGVLVFIRSFGGKGEKMEEIVISKLLIILIPTLAFGFLVRTAGLVIAVMVLVVASAYASSKFKWTWAVPLAIGSAAFCVLLFVKALGLPMPILGTWFGM